MLSEFLDLERWLQWFAGLEREFLFLLALPFVVAIIGLWSVLAGDEQAEEERAPEARRAPAPRPADDRRQRIRRREDLGRIAPHER